nr:methyltransferase domain-containing protein [Sphingomonas quercus]
MIDPDHFRERMTPERRERFFASGRADIGWQVDLLRRHYGPFHPRTAIDFGCGVGRLTCPIADIATERVYGVDVASGMREEARRNVPAHVEIVAEIPDVQVDWINSLIVFQHIHPANGVPLLARLLQALAPGGALTLHVGAFKARGAMTMGGVGMDFVSWDGDGLRTLIETPPGSGMMMMYDYDLNQVMALLYTNGIERFTVQHLDHGGHHGACSLAGRRTAEAEGRSRLGGRCCAACLATLTCPAR